MNLTQTGRFITQLRTAMGLTQAQLAQRLDVTDKAVSKWERGKSLPDITLLNRLAAELRVSVVEILSGKPLKVERSSNLDDVSSWEKGIDQAESLTLKPAEPTDLLVSPYLFGSNLEHTRSCLAAGLSAQMLRNRKFAGKPTACEGCAMEWYPIGEKGIFTFDEPYTRHGDGYHMKRTIECNSLNVFNPIAGEKVGLGQHGIAIFENRDYLFGIVARSETGAKLSVSLTDRWGKVEYDCRTIQIETENWTRYEVELRPDKSDPDSDLRITWEGMGNVCFGAISLLPSDNFRGMRRDVIEKMRELGIKILRWPGGNFAGEFNWMDGLLPVDMRAPFQSYLGLETQPHTMGFDFSEMNTDDFIALCREIGAEPFITINPCWNTPEENAAWVEYCNGSSSTKYGRIRKERGWEEPYNVQFWSLGNEFGYGHMEGDNTPGGYCRVALENGKKMLEVSPNLSLCSSGPYPSREWSELSARPLLEVAQTISQHYYGYAPHYAGPETVEKEYNQCLASVSRMRTLIRQSRQWLEPSVRISLDEWNVWSAWYRPSSVTDGIYAALVMHLLMEEAEKSGVTIACHFQAINEGMIRVRPDGAYMTAQGQVFSLMKRHMGNRLCLASLETVVTMDKDGKVVVTVVNSSFQNHKTVDFTQYGPCCQAVLYSSDTVLPPSVFMEAEVLDQICAGTLDMPPHSVLFLCF